MGPKADCAQRFRHCAAATAQTAQVKEVWEPITRAILALMQLNTLSMYPKLSPSRKIHKASMRVWGQRMKRRVLQHHHV